MNKWAVITIIVVAIVGGGVYFYGAVDDSIDTEESPEVLRRICESECKPYSASYVIREDSVWYERASGLGSRDVREKLHTFDKTTKRPALHTGLVCHFFIAD